MADRLNLELGARPWKPSADAELVEVYNRYDIPLAGLIAQGGHHYLFTCLVGHADRANLWAYTLLEDREVAELDEATDEYPGIMDRILRRRTLLVTIASEQSGVGFSTVLESGDNAPVADSLGGAQALKHLLRQFLQSYGEWRKVSDEAVSGLRTDTDLLLA